MPIWSKFFDISPFINVEYKYTYISCQQISDGFLNVAKFAKDNKTTMRAVLDDFDDSSYEGNFMNMTTAYLTWITYPRPDKDAPFPINSAQLHHWIVTLLFLVCTENCDINHVDYYGSTPIQELKDELFYRREDGVYSSCNNHTIESCVTILEKGVKIVTEIQRFVRGFLARKNVKKMKHSMKMTPSLSIIEFSVPNFIEGRYMKSFCGGNGYFWAMNDFNEGKAC